VAVGVRTGGGTRVGGRAGLFHLTQHETKDIVSEMRRTLFVFFISHAEDIQFV
jgi:hypothetical protein